MDRLTSGAVSLLVAGAISAGVTGKAVVSAQQRRVAVTRIAKKLGVNPAAFEVARRYGLTLPEAIAFNSLVRSAYGYGYSREQAFRIASLVEAASKSPAGVRFGTLQSRAEKVLAQRFGGKPAPRGERFDLQRLLKMGFGRPSPPAGRLRKRNPAVPAPRLRLQNDFRCGFASSARAHGRRA